jgi:hypothetical protein
MPKIFEYLAARRPIIAVGGPKGVVSELLDKTKAGVHISSLEELKMVLMKYYDEYKTTGAVAYHGMEEEIDKYSHRQMAKKFADVIERVAG